MNYTEKHQLLIPLSDCGCRANVANQIIGGASFTPLEQHLPHSFVYIAGPMRGIEKFNFPAFDAARDACLAAGYNVISPADIDKHAGGVNPDDSQLVYIIRDFWSLFLLASMGNCGIVLLPGWWKSVGATAEFFLARWLGLKMYIFERGTVKEYRSNTIFGVFLNWWQTEVLV